MATTVPRQRRLTRPNGRLVTAAGCHLSPTVIALRRLLIGEARAFLSLATEYFDRAPGQVLTALAAAFRHLRRRRLLRVTNARSAAAQFAYLVVGEPLDRAVLVGTIAPKAHVVACAREGVRTFLARYGAGHVR